MKQCKAWELLPEEKVYLKSEVDAEIEKLKAIRKVHIEAIESMGAGLLQDEEEILHQKYKRCLAMARWCDEVMMSCELRGYAVHRIWANRHQWAMRWKYRLLELAEKFKEAK